MPVFDDLTKVLVKLLEEDQAEKRALGKAFFGQHDENALAKMKADLKRKTDKRTQHALKILHEIGEPSISNIGIEGAQALSVLALHDASALEEVLSAFNDLYAKNKKDCHYQAIPSMTDLLLILQRKPQRYGTQWMFDKTKQPFLPTVEDFEHVNERRAVYGLESLRWPRSLAIPESEQPWLKQPLTNLRMRDMTQEEFNEFVGE